MVIENAGLCDAFKAELLLCVCVCVFGQFLAECMQLSRWFSVLKPAISLTSPSL